MKAYIVWIEGDLDGGQEVVLANSATDAKRRSELRWQGVARKHLRAKRYPRFDGYQYITDRDLLREGWTIYCGECERGFSRDTLLEANIAPEFIGSSSTCPYCNPEDYGLVVMEHEDGDLVLRPAGDAWRQGRKCATCRHYSREDEYCWRSGVMVPCHPGFDEDDPHMMAPLTCWEPAGGEQP